MTSIGPQLPSHLQKRDTDSDSDDEAGPQLESSVTAPIGPQTPAQLVAAHTHESSTSREAKDQEDEDEDEDDDSYVPALPPALAASRQSGASYGRSIPAAPKPKRVIGPSMPGHDRQEQSDDDDDYGPMPMPERGGSAGVNEGVREFIEKEERRRKRAEVRGPVRLMSVSIPILT